MNDHGIEEACEVLDYWFGAPGSPEHGQRRDMWFKDGRSFDDEIRERFLSFHAKAASGGLDRWRQDPRACLALILVLDQFPRHMFRDRPLAYATDPRALATAKHALDAGYDRDRPFFELNFFYLPFSHAEHLAAIAAVGVLATYAHLIMALWAPSYGLPRIDFSFSSCAGSARRSSTERRCAARCSALENGR